MLRISGENFDVDAFVEKTTMPGFRKYYKGEPKVKSSKRRNEHSGGSIATSEADFDDFKGQIADTIQFLTEYKNNLMIIASTPDIDYAVIDFGINSAINEHKLMQTFYFTKALIKLCAELNIEIVLSIYKEDMQVILEKNQQEKEAKKD
ncbi:MAG: hypothetical protein ACTHNW_18160 [Mucilaginibacter sp.]